MRKLFDIGITNYNVNGTAFRRPSARAIIIRDGKIGMIHSLKYDYFKFPGGGIEVGCFWNMAERAGLWERGTYGSPMSIALSHLCTAETVLDGDGNYCYTVFKLT